MSAWEAMCLSSGPKRDLQARVESHSSPLGAGRELEEEKGEAITRGKEKRNPLSSNSIQGTQANQQQLFSPHLRPKGSQDPMLGRKRRSRIIP